MFFGKRPLKWWNPLGGMKKSSLTYFNQVGVEIGTLGNEKDKEEEDHGGSIWGIARVNMMDLEEKMVWLDVVLTSFSFSFSNTLNITNPEFQNFPVSKSIAIRKNSKHSFLEIEES